MKITFDYKGERWFVLIEDVYNLWEILEDISEQFGTRMFII